MGVVKKTIIEFLLVLAVGAALGFGLNPWRGSNRIKLRNDYHPDLTAVVAAARAKADQAAGEEHSITDTENTKTESAAESKEQEIDPPEPVVPPDEPSREKAKAPDHPYQEISFKEVEEVFFDPGSELGVNVFIDARNDIEFAKGHIPGALQCDRYRLDEYIDAVLEAARVKADQAAGEERSIPNARNTETDSAGASDGREIDPPEPVVPPQQLSGKKAKQPDHPYQEMSFEEAADIYEDPNTELGVNVFIDARNDGDFVAGHIVGALQCDRYRIEDYIDEVMEAARQAEKVIIYCNGGQCDDSKAVCGELIQRGIPFYNVFLYSGGWEQWKANMMPSDTGGVE